MVSLIEMLERIGMCGRLMPFFKAVLVYCVVGGEGNPRGFLGTLAKVAPTLCLAAAVWSQRRYCKDAQFLHSLCTYIAIGELFSAAGDALLDWPGAFEPGMAAFACAHAAYWRAWGPQGSVIKRTLLAACAVGFGMWLGAPGRLGLLVPLYSLGLSLAAGRAIARANRPPWHRVAGAVGSLLFLISDALLAYGMFVSPLPHRTFLVMSTYYLAQLGIALAAFQPLKSVK